MRSIVRCLVWIGAIAAVGPLWADPPPGRQWKLVFGDEFDGQTIDRSKWNLSHHGQWKLKDIKTELTPTNSSLDGQGHFVNVLSRDESGVLRYHHGIDTRGKFEFTYGYAEARVQFSREPGWWSAFWLWGADLGVNPFLKGQEIDIYEDFFKPKRRNDVQHAVHFDPSIGFAEESDRNVGGAKMIDAKRMARVSKGCLGGELRPRRRPLLGNGRGRHRHSLRSLPAADADSRSRRHLFLRPARPLVQAGQRTLSVPRRRDRP